MGLVTPELGTIIWSMLILPIMILPFICLISILRNEFKNQDKLIWVIVVLFLPFIGPLLYLIMGRSQRITN
jgi:hypothetical protein